MRFDNHQIVVLLVFVIIAFLAAVEEPCERAAHCFFATLIIGIFLEGVLRNEGKPLPHTILNHLIGVSAMSDTHNGDQHVEDCDLCDHRSAYEEHD